MAALNPDVILLSETSVGTFKADPALNSATGVQQITSDLTEATELLPQQ